MSLNTLFEAAKFVESNHRQNNSGTRGNTPSNTQSPGASTTSDSDSEKGKRRPGGAGTREIHNRLEKNRRAHLKVCFETLKGEIPSLDERKTSNLNILKSALRYIQNLEKKTDQYSKEREDLKKHNLNLRQKLKVLRDDIKNLLELNKKNGLKVDAPLCFPAPAAESTSCVSAPVSNMLPVSVATQTMPLANKEKEENASDEEINVDDVPDL